MNQSDITAEPARSQASPPSQPLPGGVDPAALPPDWCGDFWFYVSNEEADERVFETNMVTNYENRFRRDEFFQ